MRIATPLMLGAAVFLAAAPLHAQSAGDGFKPAPAVPPLAAPANSTKAGKIARTTAPAGSPAVAAPVGAEPPPAPHGGVAVTQTPTNSRAGDDPPTAESPDAPPTAEAPAATPTASAAAPAPAAGAAAVQASPGQEAPVQEAPVQEAKADDLDAMASLQTTKSSSTSEYTNGIAASVNDQPISDYEIRQRVQLYIATSGLPKLTDDQAKRVRGQILQQLEDEKLELAEAVKKKITVSPVEVDKRINAMMAENHFTIDQLRTTLTQAGASEDALRAQITASIAWQKAVQDEFEDRVNVTPEQVAAEMARYADGADKAHFHVMEIFLPVDNPEQDAKVKKDAEEVETQLHQGAAFALVARQFSQHPSAAAGGDMGWVHAGQLAPELNTALAKMTPGMVTDPIRSTGGWYILALRERQEPLGTKIQQDTSPPVGPDSVLPLARLLLPLPPHVSPAELGNAMKIAEQIRGHIGACDQMEGFQKQLPGSVYMNLGSVKLGDLSAQIQQAMAKTKSGDVAEPFQSDAGIEIIARCDKRIPVLTPYTMPSRDQVENQLFEDQISTMARRYIRDLRRSANIQLSDSIKTEIPESDVKVR